MKKITLLFLLFFPVSAYCGCPSFECYYKELTDIEKVICQNDRLSQNDIMLSVTYRMAIDINKGNEEIIEKIKTSQKNWLLLRENKCKEEINKKNYFKGLNSECLNDLYVARINELREYSQCNRSGSLCERAESSYKNVIIDNKLSKIEKRLYEKALNARGAEKAELFIDRMKDNKIKWQEYVKSKCSTFEDFIGGSGVGARTQNCKYDEKLLRVKWLEFMINELY